MARLLRGGLFTQFAPCQPLVEIVNAPDEVNEPEAADRTAQCRMEQDYLQSETRNPADRPVPRGAPGGQQQQDPGLDAVEHEQNPDEGPRLHGGRL